MNQAVVLLSGGLDSTAALCWARARYTDLRAIWFDYGQPNRDQEDIAAGRAANALGVERVRVVTADALRAAGLLKRIPDHDSEKMGVHHAFVPGRNLLFMIIAASHAAAWFPVGTIDLVLGVCKDDAQGFPDCRVNTLSSLGDTLNRGMAREYVIRTPWIDRTKQQILYALSADPKASEIVSRSWSCYHAYGPCGRCTPCVLRGDAFKAVGAADMSEHAAPHGGDPGRNARP